jgi:DNA-binding LacI/PurR family transcriptional regulator
VARVDGVRSESSSPNENHEHAVRPAEPLTVVIVASHDNSYFSRAIGLAYENAEKVGVNVAYEPPRADRVTALCQGPDAASRRFLVVGSANFDIALAVHGAGGRAVLVGGAPENRVVPFPTVRVDELSGECIATEHLIEGGRTRLALFEPMSVARLAGHNYAITMAAKRGIAVTTRYIFEREWLGWVKNPELAEAFFAKPDAPDGVSTWNDRDGATLISILHKIGLRVPEDVAVIGWDNGPEAIAVAPQLSTVDGKLAARVTVAMKLLAEPEPDAPFDVVIRPELIARASTARS